MCSSPFFTPRKYVVEETFSDDAAFVTKNAPLPSLNCIASSNAISGTKCSNRINSFIGSLAQFGNTSSSQMSETNLLDSKCETFFAINSCAILFSPIAGSQKISTLGRPFNPHHKRSFGGGGIQNRNVPEQLDTLKVIFSGNFCNTRSLTFSTTFFISLSTF